MAEYKIITIGRQFGSGGHEIGQMSGRQTGNPSLRPPACKYGGRGAESEGRHGQEGG